jgi:hypothetical protein
MKNERAGLSGESGRQHSAGIQIESSGSQHTHADHRRRCDETPSHRAHKLVSSMIF